jgi:hypothetical protein
MKSFNTIFALPIFGNASGENPKKHSFRRLQGGGSWILLGIPFVIKGFPFSRRADRGFKKTHPIIDFLFSNLFFLQIPVMP